MLKAFLKNSSSKWRRAQSKKLLENASKEKSKRDKKRGNCLANLIVNSGSLNIFGIECIVWLFVCLQNVHFFHPWSRTINFTASQLINKNNKAIGVFNCKALIYKSPWNAPLREETAFTKVNRIGIFLYLTRRIFCASLMVNVSSFTNIGSLAGLPPDDPIRNLGITSTHIHDWSWVYTSPHDNKVTLGNHDLSGGW